MQDVPAVCVSDWGRGRGKEKKKTNVRRLSNFLIKSYVATVQSSQAGKFTTQELQWNYRAVSDKMSEETVKHLYLKKRR